MVLPNSSNDNEISLAELIQNLRAATEALWAERRIIFNRMGYASLIGLIIAFGSPVEYSASTRLLPYRGGGGGEGTGLSGLAGLAGIRLPPGGGDQTIRAELYPEVAKSLDFREAVAETPLRFSTLDRRASAIEYFRDLRHQALTEMLVSYTIGLPGHIITMNATSGDEQEINKSSIGDSVSLRHYDRKYLSLLQTLGDRLSVSIDKKTNILLISAKMPDPYAAADLVRVSAERLMERIVAYESQKAAETFRFVSDQHQQAKNRYERTQRELAMFSDRNRVLMSAASQIDRDRLQREYDIAFEVYQQFSRELEQARIKMNQDTPVFTVLDQVVVPNERTSPNRKETMLLTVLLGMLIGIAQIGLRNALSLTKTENIEANQLR